MNVLVSHPTGNPNVRAVLRGLDRNNLSPVFFTTLSIYPWVHEKVSHLPRLADELSRRVFGEVPQSRINTLPGREIVRQLAGRFGPRRLIQHETGWASTDQIYRALDRHVVCTLRRGKDWPSLLYAYEDGARESFAEAHRHSVRSVYELPTTYWRKMHKILGEERELRPTWASTIDALLDSPEKLHRKDEELSLADVVVVPSRFVAESLALAPQLPDRVEIIPYGTRPPIENPVAERAVNEPLRVLYAGNLNQGKGIAYLFEALERLDHHYELSIAGTLPAVRCRALEQELENPHHNHLGRLSHTELFKQMARSHVFVFPALREGLALVIGEALAAGLPIIATPNSGAPELVHDGIEGYIVPIRDPDRIAERLTRLYENENRRSAMAEAAKRRAAEVSWTMFEDRIADLVRELTK